MRSRPTRSTDTLQQLGDEVRGDRHQDDRNGRPMTSTRRRFARRTGDRQHVVERHRKIGENDRPQRRPEAGLVAGGIGSVEVASRPLDRVSVAVDDLTVHLPAHEQQQKAARQRQADDLQHLLCDGREQDAQNDRARDAPENHLGAHIVGNARCGHADDDRVVAGKRQVDHQNVEQRDPVRPASQRSKPSRDPLNGSCRRNVVGTEIASMESLRVHQARESRSKSQVENGSRCHVIAVSDLCQTIVPSARYVASARAARQYLSTPQHRQPAARRGRGSCEQRST